MWLREGTAAPLSLAEIRELEISPRLATMLASLDYSHQRFLLRKVCALGRMTFAAGLTIRVDRHCTVLSIVPDGSREACAPRPSLCCPPAASVADGRA